MADFKSLREIAGEKPQLLEQLVGWTRNIASSDSWKKIRIDGFVGSPQQNTKNPPHKKQVISYRVSGFDIKIAKYRQIPLSQTAGKQLEAILGDEYARNAKVLEKSPWNKLRFECSNISTRKPKLFLERRWDDDWNWLSQLDGNDPRYTGLDAAIESAITSWEGLPENRKYFWRKNNATQTECQLR